MKKYKCLICGYVWETDDPNPVCPICGASGSDVVETEEDK
jgi:nitrite reductase (NADH) large subunit